MGGLFSKYSRVYSSYPCVKEHKDEYDILQLTESDVGRLYKLYRQMDIRSTDSIHIDETLHYLSIENNEFTKRIFSISDGDHSSILGFNRFVISVWNYCTLERNCIEMFAYDMCDIDRSGNIEISEIICLIKDLYGEDFEHSVHARRACYCLGELGRTTIDVYAFCRFLKSHTALLYPAFALQTKFRTAVIGNHFWDELQRKRTAMCHNEYVPVSKLLGINYRKQETPSRSSSTECMLVRKSSGQIHPAPASIADYAIEEFPSHVDNARHRQKHEHRPSRNVSEENIVIDGTGENQRLFSERFRRRRTLHITGHYEPEHHHFYFSSSSFPSKSGVSTPQKRRHSITQ